MLTNEDRIRIANLLARFLTPPKDKKRPDIIKEIIGFCEQFTERYDDKDEEDKDF